MIKPPWVCGGFWFLGFFAIQTCFLVNIRYSRTNPCDISQTKRPLHLWRTAKVDIRFIHQRCRLSELSNSQQRNGKFSHVNVRFSYHPKRWYPHPGDGFPALLENEPVVHLKTATIWKGFDKDRLKVHWMKAFPDSNRFNIGVFFEKLAFWLVKPALSIDPQTLMS